MRRASAPPPDPPALGLRERKKERVREQLLEAAVKQFSRKGFDATTIDDIVGAVEVSRRTFFRYFDTKEDVLPAWFDRHVDAVIGMIDERPAGEDPMASLRHVLDGIAELYESKIALVLSIERVISREPSIVARRAVRLEEMAERLARRLSARPGAARGAQADMLLLARITMAIASSAVERWALGGGKGRLGATMGASFDTAREAFARCPRQTPRKRSG